MVGRPAGQIPARRPLARRRSRTAETRNKHGQRTNRCPGGQICPGTRTITGF